MSETQKKRKVSKRTSRKKRDEKEEVKNEVNFAPQPPANTPADTPDITPPSTPAPSTTESVLLPPPSKEQLRKILKEKMKAKQLYRTSQFARDNMAFDLKEKMKKAKPEDKEKLQKKLDLLNVIEEAQIAAQNNDYPDYVDNASYGGGLEHDD